MVINHVDSSVKLHPQHHCNNTEMQSYACVCANGTNDLYYILVHRGFLDIVNPDVSTCLYCMVWSEMVYCCHVLLKMVLVCSQNSCT